MMKTADAFLKGNARSKRLFNAVRRAIDAIGSAEMRVTKSQNAFRRRKAFAWVWMPGRYLHGHPAPLVLTLSFPRRDPSPRWKEIVQPAPGRFTHQVESHSIRDIDGEVRRWLRGAWEQSA